MINDLDVMAVGSQRRVRLWVVMFKSIKLRRASMIQVGQKKPGSHFNQGQQYKARVEMLRVCLRGNR